MKAFTYLHSKDLLHRDISPNNVLVKIYDDVIVVKVSDFGLVKTKESNLTSLNSEIKGAFNDPRLSIDGFHQYNVLHETFALARLMLFVMTGKIRTDVKFDVGLQEIANRGLNQDLSKRFKSTEEISLLIKQIKIA